jgi:hypothetical protein
MAHCRQCGKNHSGSVKGYCTPVCQFWSGVRIEDIEGAGCWVWQKRINPCGYAMFRYKRVDHMAHRVNYAWTHDLKYAPTLYNVCGNLACVRPDHWSTDSAYKWQTAHGRKPRYAKWEQNQVLSSSKK